VLAAKLHVQHLSAGLIKRGDAIKNEESGPSNSLNHTLRCREYQVKEDEVALKVTDTDWGTLSLGANVNPQWLMVCEAFDGSTFSLGGSDAARSWKSVTAQTPSDSWRLAPG
jgi:hypothetical protein